MNLKFHNAINNIPQKCPPVWFMRQAGRYHSHYRALREKHSFMDLCKQPELAAEVTMGPIRDFDFDVAILFSDLLFPLEAMGMGLSYESDGPRLGWNYTPEKWNDLLSVQKAISCLEFQRDAMKSTRELLPKDKSLIGFVGGPWTLFVYAIEGTHSGALTQSKKYMNDFPRFCEKLLPLLEENILLQREGGAEIVMLFDTAAGELHPDVYSRLVVPALEKLANKFPKFLAYYSKVTTFSHFSHPFFKEEKFAGMGFDHRFSLPEVFPRFSKGFVQGNFDQSLLFLDEKDFEEEAKRYLNTMFSLAPEKRSGWVSALGHGVLPKTPEKNVRRLVQLTREFSY